MTWQFDAAGFAALLVTVVSFGWRQARRQGMLTKDFKQIREEVHDHAITLTDHTAQLANGKGDFKVITEKFKGVEDKLDGLGTGQKEIRDLLITHITKRDE
jgi:hypothetical protein